MAQKWSDTQRARFIATMAAKRAAERQAAKAAEVPAPRKRRSPNEAEDFARFMAAAWKLYRGQR